MQPFTSMKKRFKRILPAGYVRTLDDSNIKIEVRYEYQAFGKKQKQTYVRVLRVIPRKTAFTPYPAVDETPIASWSLPTKTSLQRDIFERLQNAIKAGAVFANARIDTTGELPRVVADPLVRMTRLSSDLEKLGYPAPEKKLMSSLDNRYRKANRTRRR